MDLRFRPSLGFIIEMDTVMPSTVSSGWCFVNFFFSLVVPLLTRGQGME